MTSASETLRLKVAERKQREAEARANRANGSDDEAKARSRPGQTAKQNVFEDMSVDDFFSGGFEIAKDTAKSSKQNGAAKRKRAEVEEDDSSADEQPSDNDDVKAAALWKECALVQHYINSKGNTTFLLSTDLIRRHIGPPNIIRSK